MVFRVRHLHFELIDFSVSHVDRIEVVGGLGVDRQVLVLDGSIVDAPSLAGLGLELSAWEEHCRLGDRLQNNLVAMLHIVGHHIDD